MNLKKITPTGKAAVCSVNDEVFAAPINEPLIAQAVRVYLANQRQGTSAAKTRSAVIRTKAKVYRQKGTGRARHGSRNAPIFVGGGVAHGPTGQQNWSLTISKKQKRVALISALSMQKDSTVVSDIPLETSGKTKYAARFVKAVNPEGKRCLLVVPVGEETVKRAFANLPNVVVRSAAKLMIYDVVLADMIVFTSQAVADLEKRLVAPKTEEVKAVKAQAVKTQAVKTNAKVTAEAKSTPAAKVAAPKKKSAATKKKPTAKKPAAAKKTTKK